MHKEFRHLEAVYFGSTLGLKSSPILQIKIWRHRSYFVEQFVNCNQRHWNYA